MASRAPIPSIAAERCETCRYWIPWDSMGVCHRNPPMPHTTMWRTAAAADGVWPVTDRNDFCGEYQEKTHGQ